MNLHLGAFQNAWRFTTYCRPIGKKGRKDCEGKGTQDDGIGVNKSIPFPHSPHSRAHVRVCVGGAPGNRRSYHEIQPTKQVNIMKRKSIFKENNVLILNGATRINGNTDLILKTIIENSKNTEVKINYICWLKEG